MSEYVVFVFPKLWVYPEPLDSDEVTVEEQTLIDEWQERKDAIDYVVSQISPELGWELSGDFTKVVNPKHGIRIKKAGEYYISMWFRLNRMIVKNANGWVVSEMAKLTGPGLKFQGFIAKDPVASLVEKGYKLVGVEDEL